MAEPKRGSLDYLLRRAFDNGVIARAKIVAQQVPDQRAFLEQEYVEFRRSLLPEQGEWTMPGVQPHPPASECRLDGCDYPYPHSHGSD